MWRKLTSRKFLLTLASAIAVILNKELGLNIPDNISGQLLIVVVIIYIAVEGIRDMIKEGKK